jgi:hypothetical protein
MLKKDFPNLRPHAATRNLFGLSDIILCGGVSFT